MRTLSTALCAALLLGACQDIGANGPPPIFSVSVILHFAKYMKETNRNLFVVSTDGRYSIYTACPVHADACVPASGATKSVALRECREESGLPCKVYAVNGRIVWKGDVGSPRTGGHSDAPDYEICNFAVTLKDGRASWESRAAWLDSVKEAKRRNLTTESCAELLGEK